ncbi:hypothetical protein [Alistipes sp. An66]|uniref:hypothetical protein n=1 Tax=Alistipes sp. An66 TaxID=1965650 RepID=UPI0013A604AC|nr:hypothetical protein [Alistipes sp. An66]
MTEWFPAPHHATPARSPRFGSSGVYERTGFRIIGRDDLDPSGKPCPILHPGM